MAIHHPAKVFAGITGWMATPSSRGVGINAFLGIATFEEGARLLCHRAASLDHPGAKTMVITYFHYALADPTSRETALRAITIWETAPKRGRWIKNSRSVSSPVHSPHTFATRSWHASLRPSHHYFLGARVQAAILDTKQTNGTATI